MSNSTDPTTAVLGNGVVGVALARGFAGLGHRVVFGTRDVQGSKTLEALAAVPGATAASFAEAARACDLAVIALPWTALASALGALSPQDLAGKLVIDPVNPLDYSSGAPVLAVGHSDSAGEQVQRLLPLAKVVKAFNTIGASNMVHPQFADGMPDMFIAGNDGAAKAQVVALLRAFGWRGAVDLGDIEASRLLEPMAMAWIRYGLRHNHWSHGFSLLGQAEAA